MVPRKSCWRDFLQNMLLFLAYCHRLLSLVEMVLLEFFVHRSPLHEIILQRFYLRNSLFGFPHKIPRHPQTIYRSMVSFTVRRDKQQNRPLPFPGKKRCATESYC